MEIIKKQIGDTTNGERILRICLLFIFLFFAAPQISVAQEPDSSTIGAIDSAAAEDGPSISNLTKTMAAGNEEMKRIQEKARRDEILSYIYMGVGFAIVIAIAWFTTTLARKRKRKEDEIRALRLSQTKHKPHHHHHPRR